MCKSLFFIGFFSFCFQIFGQQVPLPRHLVESGYPFIQNYTPDIYGKAPQNFTIVQDHAGIIYVGNNEGILAYDGNRWEFISLPNKGGVYSLAVDAAGQVYVGGEQELGYLAADSMGETKYISLLEHLAPEDRDVAAVWRTHATPQGIYFKTDDALLRWSGEEFKIWKINGEPIWRSFWVNNQLFVQVLRPGQGLLMMKNDSLQAVPNGDRFIKDPIYCMLPMGQNQIIIGSNINNLLLYEDGNMKPFRTEIDNYFKDNILYNGIVLNDSTLAFATISGGLVVIDRYGRQRLRLDDRMLPSLVVYYLYQDRSGLLWAGTSFGISKIEYPSPYSGLNKETELKGQATAVVRYNNRLFMGTEAGLFCLNERTPDHHPSFSKIGDYQYRIWDLLIVEQQLLAVGEDGIYAVKNNKLDSLYQCRPAAVVRSKLDSSRIFIGEQGLSSLYFENGRWKKESKIKGIQGGIFLIEEMQNGDLWLGTNISEVWRVSFSSREKALLLEDPIIERFDATNKHPEDVFYLHAIDNEAYFVGTFSKKIYRFDLVNKVFYLDDHLPEKLGIPDEPIYIKSVDKAGNIWFSVLKEGQIPIQKIAWKQANGSYQVEELQEHRISDISAKMLYFDQEDSVIWYGGLEGNFRHDLKVNQFQQTVFGALVRKVIYQDDSLIFAGAPTYNHQASPAFPFKRNYFRFKYALPSFRKESVNQFQHFLEGFDPTWSDWTYEAQKDYTNLPEGHYHFRVRARNINGQMSDEDSFAFTILPPWYRTWWAYLLYALAFAGFVGWVVQWRSARLRREKEVLENIVKERTQQLEQQAEQLKEMDQMKSRLFANISHEFRTPLTLIKGPVAELVKSGKENLRLSDAWMIDRNADRLLRLVNQLLDLSKLDAGNLELEPEAGDIYQFLRALAAAFSSHAEQRGMTYRIAIPQNALYASFDHDKLEKIMYNLLSNAFKFTPDGGEVIIKASCSNAQLELKVKDSGRGIAPEQLPHIFDRFYQTDGSATREQEGTGIGLALTKELVSLMDGEMSVQSESGKGSAFTVTLPLTAMAIAEQEVAGKEIFTQHVFEENIVSEKETPVADGKRKQEAPMVLIVEDNADMRNFIQEQLNNEYEILEAAHGQLGLELALQEIPDLIITDLMMPQMDGMELCQQLKTDERTSHIPVIMLTAKAGQAHKIEGLETGADDYLTKPFDRQELHVRVKNLIVQRQELRKRFSREVTLEPKQVAISSLDEQFLQKIMDLLEENLADADFGMAEMQEALAMSKTQLYRKIKSLTDQSPGEFIRNYRLKRAAQILSRQGDNVTQVAYAVGFNNLSYFAKCFKELYGVAPSAYIDQPLS